MTAFLLKLLALVTMMIDHTGAVLGDSMSMSYLSPPVYDLMRTIGRAAFPIYAFFLVEGFRRTHSRPNYALRLLGCGVLSQLPYAFTVNAWVRTIPELPAWHAFTMLNILFTLLMGLLLLCWLEWAAPRRAMRTWGAAAGCGVFAALLYLSTLYEPALFFGAAAVLIAVAKLSGRTVGAGDQLARLGLFLLAVHELRRFLPIEFDYGSYAFLLFAALYWAKTPRRCALIVAAWGLIVYSGLWWQVAVVACAAAMLACYNGKRGPDDHRLFYWAYPAHLFVLWGVVALLS